MPKCEVDDVLQDQVRRFVRDNGLTVSGAGMLLGINRTTFWRFHESGEALGGTRARIRQALEKRNMRTEDRVADDAVAVEGKQRQVRSMLRDVPERDLVQIRKACEGVLALLNAYDAQRRKNLNGPRLAG